MGGSPHAAPNRGEGDVTIALYPDPLLAQVLASATYPADSPDAARWADGHVPSVLDMMAHDMPWTQELGDAVLAERAAVMDAVQRMRHQAWT